MKKRIFSIMMCLCMVLMLFPATAFAEESGSITINGGKLGGMVNIGDLTSKINELVQSFNNHTHTGNMGSPTSTPMAQAKTFNKSDYEDTKIKH